MKIGISLITMGAGNILVAKETFKSASTVCDQIVYGDMLLWEQDREILKSYQSEFNLKIVPFKFDYIFRNGFASLLNELAKHADNDYVMYLNTSEIIEIDYGILDTINNNPDCNAFYFTHPSENHRWFRTYNRHELEWSGRIHEQLKGEYKPFHKSIFQMKDLPKDMDSEFKAKVLDTAKEILYFTNYMSIIDFPEQLGETDPGWIKFATENYESFKERLLLKGDGYKAYQNGDLNAFLYWAENNPEFGKQQFESNIGIEYQQSPMFLGKK